MFGPVVGSAACYGGLRQGSGRLPFTGFTPNVLLRRPDKHPCSPSPPSAAAPSPQGRLPIRVELRPLSRHDFLRILTEPEYNLVKQQQVGEGRGGRQQQQAGRYSSRSRRQRVLSLAMQ